MQNARKPRVRRKNQRSRRSQRNEQGQKGRRSRQGAQAQHAEQAEQAEQAKDQQDRQDQQDQQVEQQRQPLPLPTQPHPPQPRPMPPAAEPQGPEPYEAHPRPHPYAAPHPRRPPHPPPYRTVTVTGRARRQFPSPPAAHLAGIADRARRLADRFLLPRTPAERVLDLTLGTALLILTAPAVAVAALALSVRRAPGGVWDRRPRAGLGGRVFELRTLRTRRLRLDLLSRLPHVARGDLSLVGPAPLAPGDPRAARSDARQWRQELRPGLTGLAQVRARSRMPWDDPALLDQHYAEHHGVVLDLAILAEAARGPLRTRLRKARRTKAHLSDADHRRPGYSTVE